MAVPLFAGLLASAYGTGYQATKFAQHDGGAWVATLRSAAHIGTAGQVDAQSNQQLGRGKPPAVDQTADGEVYATDPKSGQVWKIDTTTAAATPVSGTGETDQLEVVTGADTAYVVDSANLTVGSIGGDNQVGRPADGFGSIDDVVVDSGGDAWILDNERQQVWRIGEDGRTKETFSTDSENSRLTLAADQPVVVDTARNQVTPLTGEGAGKAIPLLAEIGDEVEVNAPSSDGSLWLADEGSGGVWRVDLRSREVTPGPDRVGQNSGPLVEHGDRVYVPDYQRREVRVLDAASLEEEEDKTVKVEGDPGEFEMFVNNDKVWIHDPVAQHGSFIGLDGDERKFDKGAGNGATNGQHRDDDSRDAPAGPQSEPDSGDPGPEDVSRESSSPSPDDGGRDTSSSAPDNGSEDSARDTDAAAGPSRVAVPDLSRLAVDEACDALDRLGLTCRSVPDTGASGDPGTVVDVDPAPGTRVRPGRVVKVHHVPNDSGEPVGPPSGSATAAASPPPGTAPATQPPATVAVPAVVGADTTQACTAVTAAGLQCTTAVEKAPARPFTVHRQDPAADAPVAPGTPVTVFYDDTALAALYRIKRIGTNVWIVGTDKAHIDNLMASGRYSNQVVLGYAYPCCTRGVGHLASIYSFHKPDTAHDGDNQYYSSSNTPPGPNWQLYGPGGEIGQVLGQVAGTVPLDRYVKHHDGTADYAYATTDADRSYYQQRGFQYDGTLGYIWP